MPEIDYIREVAVYMGLLIVAQTFSTMAILMTLDVLVKKKGWG